MAVATAVQILLRLGVQCDLHYLDASHDENISIKFTNCDFYGSHNTRARSDAMCLAGYFNSRSCSLVFLTALDVLRCSLSAAAFTMKGAAS